MKRTINKLFATLISIAMFIVVMLPTLVVLSGCGGDKEQGTPPETPKSEYVFVYDQNYEGSDLRTVNVKAGTRANNWKPSRVKYTFEGWYEDRACSEDKKFDFSQYINKDTTVYAHWIKNPEAFVVTFDFNYSYAADVQIDATEGEIINSEYIPSSPRLGQKIEGWYTDEACSENKKFDLTNDKVQDNMTLYANYAPDESVPRNQDGSIKYENIEIYVCHDASCDYDTSGLKSYVDKFNQEYSGKIKVNMLRGDVGGSGATIKEDDQSKVSLRFKMAYTVNERSSNYYSVNDVYDFAGIDFNADDWNQNAIKDSYIDGKLYTAPVFSAAPYMIYNKELMAKYLGDGQTVNDINTYTAFSNLLKKAYDGEHATNANFNAACGILGHWSSKQYPSVAFLQNDADYFVMDNGKLVTKYGDEAVKAKAVTALTNLNNVFGASGSLHGSIPGSHGDMVNKVKNKNALFGMVSMASFVYSTSQFIDLNKLGIMPVSGLFTDATEAYKDSIPVHNVGFGFYKAADLSLTELGACAVFADYVAKQDNMADFGWYPTYKATWDSDAFKTSTAVPAQVLRQIGNPLNFRTLDGRVDGFNIINKSASETYIVPALQNTLPDINKVIDDFAAAMQVYFTE